MQTENVQTSYTMLQQEAMGPNYRFEGKKYNDLDHCKQSPAFKWEGETQMFQSADPSQIWGWYLRELLDKGVRCVKSQLGSLETC